MMSDGSNDRLIPPHNMHGPPHQTHGPPHQMHEPPHQIHDGWSLIVRISLYTICTPLFNYDTTMKDRIIMFTQGAVALALVALSIFATVHLFIDLDFLHQRGMLLCFSLGCICLYIYYILLILFIWIKRDKVRQLIIDYKYYTDVAINALQETETVRETDRNTERDRKRNSERERVYHKNVIRFIRLLFLLIWNVASYLIFFGLKEKYVRDCNRDLEPLNFTTPIWLPTYIFLMLTEMFFITICWMICSRFRHMNESIKKRQTERDIDLEKFKLIIQWLNINLEQIEYFKNIFNIPMATYFLFKSYTLILALETLLYYFYQTVPLEILICYVFFNIHRIAVVIYIVKQINDISIEASKTSKRVNSLCLTSNLLEHDNNFKKMYSYLCKSGYLSTDSHFKLLGLYEINGSFLTWFIGLTYAILLTFHNLKPFSNDSDNPTNFTISFFG